MAVIEKRLAAAAEADFVMVMLIQERQATWQFARACALIGQHGAGNTVGLVRNAYRPDQSVVLTPCLAGGGPG